MGQTASVLVVDDDYAIRDSLSQILEDEGYQVSAAASGLDALGILRDKPNPPCLILLDLAMPIMDGWEFRKSQLSDERLKSIPVIVLTADGRARQKAADLDADGFMEKPVRFADLIEIVERYCVPPPAAPPSGEAPL